MDVIIWCDYQSVLLKGTPGKVQEILFCDLSVFLHMMLPVRERSNPLQAKSWAYFLLNPSLISWRKTQKQTCLPLVVYLLSTLQWRHNGHDSVSNHQPHDGFLNFLFRHISKKTSMLRVTGLCAGHRRPGDSPHKWPLTRKKFAFDDVIM